jgi:N utilization substance protein B
VQGLYQWQISHQDEASILAQAAEVAGFEKTDQDLYRSLLRQTMADGDALEAALSHYVDRSWKEISPVERSILLLGACELKHFPDTPYRVVLNEAVELAKRFGGTDGHKFVNGVLDKLSAALRPSEG